MLIDTDCHITGSAQFGAAFGPLMLTWIGDEMTEYDLGTRGLLHCANDNGLRAALVVQHD